MYDELFLARHAPTEVEKWKKLMPGLPKIKMFEAINKQVKEGNELYVLKENCNLETCYCC